MENKNTRNIILTILGIAILGGIGLYFASNNNDKVKEVEVVENIEVVPEFGDITNFVKSDLTDEQKEDLKIILEQRKERQIQIKDILDQAYEKGDMEDAWIQVAEMREKCKGRIMPYIAEDKIKAFEEYCRELGEKIEADYVQK